MQVTETLKPREVEEFEITTSKGDTCFIHVCEAEGDLFTTDTDAIYFHITEKKGILPNGANFPSEDTTFFKRHIMAIRRRKRILIPPTAEEKASWLKTAQDIISKSERNPAY